MNNNSINIKNMKARLNSNHSLKDQISQDEYIKIRDYIKAERKKTPQKTEWANIAAVLMGFKIDDSVKLTLDTERKLRAILKTSKRYHENKHTCLKYLFNTQEETTKTKDKILLLLNTAEQCLKSKKNIYESSNLISSANKNNKELPKNILPKSEEPKLAPEGQVNAEIASKSEEPKLLASAEGQNVKPKPNSEEPKLASAEGQVNAEIASNSEEPKLAASAEGQAEINVSESNYKATSIPRIYQEKFNQHLKSIKAQYNKELEQFKNTLLDCHSDVENLLEKIEKNEQTCPETTESLLEQARQNKLFKEFEKYNQNTTPKYQQALKKFKKTLSDCHSDVENLLEEIEKNEQTWPETTKSLLNQLRKNELFKEFEKNNKKILPYAPFSYLTSIMRNGRSDKVSENYITEHDIEMKKMFGCTSKELLKYHPSPNIHVSLDIEQFKFSLTWFGAEENNDVIEKIEKFTEEELNEFIAKINLCTIPTKDETISIKIGDKTITLSQKQWEAAKTASVIYFPTILMNPQTKEIKYAKVIYATGLNLKDNQNEINIESFYNNLHKTIYKYAFQEEPVNTNFLLTGIGDGVFVNKNLKAKKQIQHSKQTQLLNSLNDYGSNRKINIQFMDYQNQEKIDTTIEKKVQTMSDKVQLVHKAGMLKGDVKYNLELYEGPEMLQLSIAGDKLKQGMFAAYKNGWAVGDCTMEEHCFVATGVAVINPIYLWSDKWVKIRTHNGKSGNVSVCKKDVKIRNYFNKKEYA